MFEKICLHSMTFLGRKQGPDTAPHPAYTPSLAFSMPEKGKGEGSEESKANLQMASLTQPAVFPSLPKNSKDHFETKAFSQ